MKRRKTKKYQKSKKAWEETLFWAEKRIAKDKMGQMIRHEMCVRGGGHYFDDPKLLFKWCSNCNAPNPSLNTDAKHANSVVDLTLISGVFCAG